MQKLTTNDIVDLVRRVSEIIIENEVYFCELDSVAGDGDFGMSVAKGFKQLQAEWSELNTVDIGAFMKDCSMVITSIVVVLLDQFGVVHLEELLNMQRVRRNYPFWSWVRCWLQLK